MRATKPQISHTWLSSIEINIDLKGVGQDILEHSKPIVHSKVSDVQVTQIPDSLIEIHWRANLCKTALTPKYAYVRCQKGEFSYLRILHEGNSIQRNIPCIFQRILKTEEM